MPSPGAVALLISVGAAAIIAATVVARRAAPAIAGRPAGLLAPLVPWLGSALTVLLLVRGALAGAAVVAVATLVHALVARWRSVEGDRRERGG